MPNSCQAVIMDYQRCHDATAEMHILTFSNICVVNRGNAAPTAERTIVLAARADAVYPRYVSTKNVYHTPRISHRAPARKQTHEPLTKNEMNTMLTLAPMGMVARAGTYQGTAA